MALVLGNVLGVVTQGGESAIVQDVQAGAGAVVETEQGAPPLAESAQAPAAAMAAPAEDSTEAAIAEETADATPPPLERAVVQESEEEEDAAAPVAGALAATTETVTTQDEAEAVPAPGAVSLETKAAVEASDSAADDDGIRLPVWQLEAAAGGLFAVMAISTLWMAMRRRRQSGR